MKSKSLHFDKPNFLQQALVGSRKVDNPKTNTTGVYYKDSAVSKQRRLKFKKRRNILLAIVAVLISIVAIAYYQYNKPALEVAEAAGESIAADALLTAFSTNEAKANEQYLNKVLQVTGKVTDTKQAGNNNLQVLLDANDPMSTIACTVENNKQEVKAGQTITVKGICTGYLNDVVLIRCVLVPQK